MNLLPELQAEETYRVSGVSVMTQKRRDEGQYPAKSDGEIFILKNNDSSRGHDRFFKRPSWRDLLLPIQCATPSPLNDIWISELLARNAWILAPIAEIGKSWFQEDEIMNVLVLHPITESFRTKDGAWSPRLEKAVSFETAQRAIEDRNDSVHDTSQVILEVNGIPGSPRSKVKLREEMSSKASHDFVSDALGLPPAAQAI